MPLLVGFSMALSAAFGVSGDSTAAVANAAPVEQPAPVVVLPTLTIREYVETSFVDEPIMVAISKCESQFKQYNKDGRVLKNPTSSAIGVFQIMSSLHSEYADEKLGLDIKTVEGNVAYAKYLYEKEGTRPWASSAACWSKSKAAQNLALAAN